ncbi:restriction endonuclease [Mycobacterium lentiflavum]|uniref:Restriction endonuclease n=1 Tax=Mycobacterium lentiflavum TaxID=141349 RepID=A0A0E3WB89_MYCLN|nr:restriction endonuclease [Mycobacterium lentiflavum]CQD04671.1 restriction endonuclease [Mycobacterium lentiflavum]
MASAASTKSEDSDKRLLKLTRIYRYPRGGKLQDEVVDGYPNFHYLTSGIDGKRVQLESGINLVRLVDGVDGARRPVILLRSSPWKAGGETTPWHDFFDLDHGHVRYFGDQKAMTMGPVGSTRGNAALAEAALLHMAKDPGTRALAPPLMVFRAVTQEGAVKGYVEFCGAAVIERVEILVQRDPLTGVSFPNYVFDLAVLNTALESETIDWRWIDDRRNPHLSLKETLRYAPEAWREWVKSGESALPRIRRQVAASRVLSKSDQQPHTANETKALTTIYSFFASKKHAFEALAATVTAELLDRQGARYQFGWLTRGSGDGGTDFVGRLDVGFGQAKTSLVVLGQAKCISPDSSVSAEQLARVVARLRRGWIGVYATTGVYSRAAQIEMVEDQYPIILIDGRTLAESVWRLAMDAHGGNLLAYLTAVTADYQKWISVRRPEEILSVAQ